MEPGRPGPGIAAEVGLAVPAENLSWWAARLASYGARIDDPETRFGERVLPFTDPHGLRLALVETTDPRDFAPWDRSPVPVAHQIRGLHGVRLQERDLGRTAQFLTGVLAFSPVGTEGGWQRFAVAGGGSGRFLDLHEVPDQGRGAWGVGAVHHLALRVPDEIAQHAVRTRVLEAGRRPTDVIDRFWFKSVYFTEPGGTLFELATEGPGFAVDEARESLGERLVLPPWLEARRALIEAALPPLGAPALAGPAPA